MENRIEIGFVLKERYRIEGMIGQGGLGTVYRIWDLRLEKYWALKTVNKEETEEGELLIHLSHKGIPMIVDMFAFEEYFCMIMEYIEGETLGDYLRRRGNLSETESLEKAIVLAEILRYLHSLRPAILYLDLKPANIMIRDSGELILLDYGTALISLRENKNKEHANPYKLYGTHGYAPPEQQEFKKGNVVDERSDIYSLGVILYYMITGHEPNKPPYELKDIREIDSSHSKDISNIIKKATSNQKNQRFSSAFYMKEKMKERLKKKKCKCKRRILILIYIVLLLLGIVMLSWNFPLGIIIMAIAGLWKRIVISSKWRNKWILQEKTNLVLTYKKTIGLLLLFFMFLNMSSFTMVDNQEDKSFFVETVDSTGRKLLIKTGTVYQTTVPLYFEVLGSDDHEVSIQGGKWKKGKTSNYQLNIEKLKEAGEGNYMEISFRGRSGKVHPGEQRNFFISYG